MNRVIRFQCIVLAFLLAIFVHQQIVFSNQDSSSELAAYVNDYRELLDRGCPTRSYSKQYSVQMGNGHGDWIGLCEMPLMGFRVTIDRDWWGRARNNVDRRQVVYHELSHCFLGKMHVKDEHNYMYYQMNELAYEQYMPQVEADIQDWCNGN